ncbi:hypothetical protein VULLAG_LOCUS15367 [Vulpes lagopus]
MACLGVLILKISYKGMKSFEASLQDPGTQEFKQTGQPEDLEGIYESSNPVMRTSSQLKGTRMDAHGIEDHTLNFNKFL